MASQDYPQRFISQLKSFIIKTQNKLVSIRFIIIKTRKKRKRIVPSDCRHETHKKKLEPSRAVVITMMMKKKWFLPWDDEADALGNTNTDKSRAMKTKGSERARWRPRRPLNASISPDKYAYRSCGWMNCTFRRSRRGKKNGINKSEPEEEIKWEKMEN